MSFATAVPWETKRTAETRRVEKVLRQGGFKNADAYRYNTASIRVRVIDPRFEGLPTEERDALIEPLLESLPERTQGDIISLFTFAPSELKQSPKTLREYLQNSEFDHPSPSVL